MSTMNVNGVELWYEFAGEGEVPLVHLHGLALGHMNFRYVTPFMRPHFRVLDYDMAGFGDSGLPPRPYSWQDWTDELLEVMDRLEIERAHVHATASAGPIGLQFAADHPDRVEKLVLSASFGRYDDMARAASAAKRSIVRALGMGETLAQIYALEALTRSYLETEDGRSKVATMTKTFAAQDADVWLHVQELRETVDVEPLLARIVAPTLYINGDLDIMTPVDMGPSGLGMRRMAELTPNGVLDIVEGCGHLILGEAAEDTSTRIIRFLVDG